MDREQTIAVWDGGVHMRVLSAGVGPALVFLHGPWGLVWDSFLDDLARSFTVYAPEHPGTTPDAHDDIYRLDGLWDLILCHDELLTALKIEEALVVGHSFGGMVACELAAAYPQRVRRLALIDPIGFWRDTDPIVNWVKLSPAELPGYIFRNPAVEAAQRMFGPSEPPDAAIAARVRLMWAMGATSKFIWPIPDKGLKKRIHRVSAPTLVVWGADDRLVPSVYADEFSKRLASARVHIITGAGHAPHLEHPAAVAGLVRDFLTATP
jgi:pimeloyl-ACP methyl ester carboxylesterase